MSSRSSPRSLWAWHNAAQFRPRAWHQALSAPPRNRKGPAIAKALETPKRTQPLAKGLPFPGNRDLSAGCTPLPLFGKSGFCKGMQVGPLTLYKGFIHLDQRAVITIHVFQCPTQGSFFCTEWRTSKPRGSWRQKRGSSFWGMRKDSSVPKR